MHDPSHAPRAAAEASRQRHQDELQRLTQRVLAHRSLVVASNRGPVAFERGADGSITSHRGTGGVITALSGISHHANPIWVAAAMSDADRQQARQAQDGGKGDGHGGGGGGRGHVQWADDGHRFRLSFVVPPREAYDGYYNTIANPLLWFLQHNMWDAPRTPTIDEHTWRAWRTGYEKVNELFADRIIDEADTRAADGRAIVMLHDYHLYLCPAHLRKRLGDRAIIHHFIHIPCPGAEAWTMLPHHMRRAIFQSLCANDIIGVQTRRDVHSLLDACARHLPTAHVDWAGRCVQTHGHTTWIRPYPISIDTDDLQRVAASDHVARYRDMLAARLREQTIVRVDRVEPSKNILRGFQALELLLRHHREHRERIKFLALMVPSRLGIEQYQRYLTEVSGAAAWINAEYGTGVWNPIEVFVGDNYPRAVAAMQLYDVLLVNPIVDGMNLISKEGPTVNQRHGVLVLSEGAGSCEQLGDEAVTVSAYDVVETATALDRALRMDDAERRRRSEAIRCRVIEQDLSTWLAPQLTDIERLEREGSLL